MSLALAVKGFEEHVSTWWIKGIRSPLVGASRILGALCASPLYQFWKYHIKLGYHKELSKYHRKTWDMFLITVPIWHPALQEVLIERTHMNMNESFMDPSCKPLKTAQECLKMNLIFYIAGSLYAHDSKNESFKSIWRSYKLFTWNSSPHIPCVFKLIK